MNKDGITGGYQGKANQGAPAKPPSGGSSGKKDDGGPAFPVAEDHKVADQFQWTQGMSLRDWYAGQALAGMLAHSTRYRPRQGAPSNWHDAISEEAYELADAMLAARKGGGA